MSIVNGTTFSDTDKVTPSNTEKSSGVISRQKSLKRNVSYNASSRSDLKERPGGPSRSASGSTSGVSSAESSRGRKCMPKHKFVADRMVGQGAFGSVYLATDANSGEKVAIKKVLQDVQYINRELLVMKKLSKYPHPCIIQLKQYFMTKENDKDNYLNLVLEYVPETLHSLLAKYSKVDMKMPVSLVQVYIYQLARALAHIHGLGITHRDLKPQNILVEEASLTLKLCDFGSAKQLVPGEPNVAYICSRHYRAPELMFGSIEYSTAIDVWSLGCVMAELLLGSPIFPGCSSMDQVVEVMKVLGAPSFGQLVAMNPSFATLKLPNLGDKCYLAGTFKPAVPSTAVDVMAAMFEYIPAARPPAIEVCVFPFFDYLRAPDTRLPNGQPVPNIYFELTDKEISLSPNIATLHSKIIPSHMAKSVGDKGEKYVPSGVPLGSDGTIVEGNNETLSVRAISTAAKLLPVLLVPPHHVNATSNEALLCANPLS